MALSSNLKRQRPESPAVQPRAVRFEDDSETRTVYGGWRRQDITPQEWKRTWFSKRELHLIKKRNVQIAAWSCMSKDTDDSTNTTSRSSTSSVGGGGTISREEQRAGLYGETCRGLEKWVHPQQRSAAKQWRHWSRKSVMLEQQRQRYLGVRDDAQLGRVAAQKSVVARSHATLRGMLDELEVSRLSLQRHTKHQPLDELPFGARIMRGQVNSQPRKQFKRQEVLIADRTLAPRKGDAQDDWNSLSSNSNVTAEKTNIALKKRQLTMVVIDPDTPPLKVAKFSVVLPDGGVTSVQPLPFL